MRLLSKVFAEIDSRSLEWNISKGFDRNLGLQFFSQSRNWVWPSSRRQYTLTDLETHQFRINCEPGERVCFGAWLDGRSRQRVWGVGTKNKRACKTCCGVCGRGPFTSNLVW